MAKPDKATHSKPVHHVLTAEEYYAGKTPNSGKLTKHGKPVPGQTPEADARRAAERALEQAADDAEDGDPTVTPSPTPAPQP